MALFPPGKGGGEEIEYGYKGKGSLIHILVDGNGLILAGKTSAANGDERQQVEDLLRSEFNTTLRLAKELYADKGYDAEWLRDLCRLVGIEPQIARREWPKSEDPTPITKGKRWVVERSFAWLQKKFRRIVVRWERKVSYWNAFISLSISFTLIQKLLLG